MPLFFTYSFNCVLFPKNPVVSSVNSRIAVSINDSLLSVPPTGSISATALLDSIIVERRKEFALEGHRIFDLNRTQTNYVKINSAGNSTSRLIQYSATTSSYYYRTILPIPVTQVQNNPKMVQNPGF